MRCSEVRENLVAYERGELGPDETSQVREHVDQCPECQREYESLQGFFGNLRQNIPPLEPSADFRRRLLEGLGMPASYRTPARPSSRRMRRAREEGVGLLERLRLRVRRSPYLAVSVLAHAALVMLLTYVFVAEPWRDDDVVNRVRIPHQDIDQMRRNAPNTRRAVDGDRVSLSGVCEKAASVYLTAGDREGSLWGFPTGGEATPEQEFLGRVKSEDRKRLHKVDLEDGAVALPAHLLKSVLGAAKEVVILAMPTETPRIEIWNALVWEEFLREGIRIDTRLAIHLPDQTSATALPRGTAWRREDDIALRSIPRA